MIVRAAWLQRPAGSMSDRRASAAAGGFSGTPPFQQRSVSRGLLGDGRCRSRQRPRQPPRSAS
jgi:hypothetical protein